MNVIILEVAALLLSLFCLIYSLTARRRIYFPAPKSVLAALKNQHFCFLMMLLSMVISAASSVAAALGQSFHANAGLLELLNTLYYVFHNALSLFFVLYFLDMSGPVREMGWRFFLVFSLPLIVAELLILSNPLTHMCFSVDSMLNYQRGGGLWSLYTVAAVYTVIGYLYFFRFKGGRSKAESAAALILITVAIVGVFIQAIWSVLVELFFESIAFLGFMVLLERERDDVPLGDMGKQFSGSVIVAIALTFFAVILMNVTLNLNLTRAQSDEIGRIQLEIIRDDLQDTVSEAETNVLRVAVTAGQLMDSDPPREEIERFFAAQREAFRTDGSFMNVYIAGEDWHVIPGFAAPPGYRASERVWYCGAVSQPGAVFISEPYRDAVTHRMCFTVSVALADGETVVGMDYDLSRAQETIAQMTDGRERTALIVTADGLIVGCSDMSLVGEPAAEVLPEYAEVLRRVAASNAHGSFRVRVDGTPCVIFSAETGNRWYLILSENARTIYAGSYNQMTMMTAVNLLMLVVVVVFYMVSTRSRLQTVETLQEKERFIDGLAGRLREPVTQILRLSDWRLIEESEEPTELVGQIKDAGLLLRETINDMQSYSGILREQNEKRLQSERGRDRSTGVPSRKMRDGVIMILLFAMLIALYFSVRSTVRLGGSHMDREADGYESELNAWFGERRGVMRMLTGTLSTRPALLEDVDGTVMILDGIAGKYPEFSACYIANPDAPHPLIVNSSRQSDERFRERVLRETGTQERAGEEVRVSAPFVDEATGETCFTLTRVVYSEAGEFIGMFGIDCSIEQPIRALRERYGDPGYAFLVDVDGKLVNHPNTAYQFNGERRVSVEDTEYAEAYHSESVTILRDYSGRFISCLSRVTDSGYTVMVAERCWSVYGSMVLLALASLGLFAVCIVLIVWLINRMIRWQEEVNRQLVSAADAAVDAGKAKSQFLAQMSHEIRTPINAVLGMNEMILSESSDPEILEYAANIQSAGRTLLSLINSILDFSKLEDGKMELLRVRYETRRMIDDLVNIISERAVKKGLDLELDIDPALPRSLYGDDMRIRQVVSNLLTNAVKYTPAGTVRLRMQLLTREEERCEIAVSVSDTGIGIREEDIRRLYDPFRRLDPERNRDIEGTGLGIVIVQRLLTMMDSALEVESVYGKGSTFSFRLMQQVVDWEPIGQYRLHRSEDAPAPTRRKTVWAPEADVLAVDDNEMNLHVLKGLLKRFGITPDLADSGAQCLEMTAKKHYDLILLDHMMPVMDGIETLRALRSRGDLPEDTVIVVQTANAVQGAREEYLRAGFRDYLAKPVEVEELNRMLARYLPERKRGWKNERGNAPAADAPPKTGDPLTALEAAGFHTGAGLRYAAGDRAFYMELLRAFAQEQEARAQTLRDDAARRDLHAYRILVHALKSSARQIGADALADLAQAQETAAKQGELAAVEAGCAPLLERCRAAAEAIRTALDEACGDASPAQDVGEELAAEALRAALDEALACLASFETERAGALLHAVAPHTFRGQPLAPALEGVLRSIGDFETDTAAQQLSALRDEWMGDGTHE